ncbi:MAG TPA: peptidoglycan-binding protein [Coleofasciculaceae cyanobacterium]
MLACDTRVTTSTPIVKPLLQLGSQGDAVKELQTLLVRWGTYIGAIDGLFSILVKNAVIAYQHRVFLVKDGIVGPLTWQALEVGEPVHMPVLRQGSTGKTVLMLQRLLSTTGDYRDVIDGDFGLRTQAAVKVFQKRYGLFANGIVRDRTWYFLSTVPH